MDALKNPTHYTLEGTDRVIRDHFQCILQPPQQPRAPPPIAPSLRAGDSASRSRVGIAAPDYASWCLYLCIAGAACMTALLFIVVRKRMSTLTSLTEDDNDEDDDDEG